MERLRVALIIAAVVAIGASDTSEYLSQENYNFLFATGNMQCILQTS